MNINEKRIAFVDLDGTLISTATGETFPKGVWDMTLNLDVMMKLGRMRPTAIFIVSNQGGIEQGFVNHRLFEQKFMYVIASLQDICGQHVFVAGRYCPTTKEDDPMRKPNTGMLTAMLDEFQKLVQHSFTKDDCVMIGDREDDRQTAENFGIDYLSVEEFKEVEVDEPRFRIVNGATGEDIPDQPFLLQNEIKEVIEGLRKEHPDIQYAYVTEKFVCPPQQKPNRQQRRAAERKAVAKPTVIDMSKVVKRRQK